MIDQKIERALSVRLEQLKLREELAESVDMIAVLDFI
jgi:hypothetical protein